MTNTATQIRPPEAQTGQDEFAQAVLDGLQSTPKAIPSKFFYDTKGSHLFEQICELEEYYPTRVELGILEAHAPDIAAIAGPDTTLVEFGSGAGVKVRLLLDALDAPRAYVPIDISRDHLLASSAQLNADYPDLSILPVHADFATPFDMPRMASSNVVGFFPGSTIGNLTAGEAEDFLHSAAETLGKGAGMVIGVDLIKDRDVLRAAYDDRKGVTAAFNLNLLERINRDLNGTFDLSHFTHKALFNETESRIEMHIEATQAQTVTVAGRPISFEKGERIHTENSHKYTVPGFSALAGRAGWSLRAVWTDENDWFAVLYLQRLDG
ncbi:L-histidine N(alpha)-methyltransferase [Rhodospirillum sp. A1_3_36]|uniref:L-histidine N(alpha)-methyltransferase n=1 Tax=Rhodospirillum sp. A1_3_36 TaxID=3391666 RepID=UPI0039A5831D